MAVLPACQSQGPQVVTAATEAQRQDLLGMVQSLEGTWVNIDENGAVDADSRIEFRRTSGGSAVREIMFPGAKHEMTNLYHMDGPDLLVTHYCAMGNQPRMRAHSVRHTARGREIHFEVDSVTNWTSPTQARMAELTLVYDDASGLLTEEWRSIESGKPSEHAVFKFRRQ